MTRDEYNNISAQFALKPELLAVYVVNSDITADSYTILRQDEFNEEANTLILGENSGKRQVTIPKGTKIVVCSTNCIETIGPTVTTLEEYINSVLNRYEIAYEDIEFLEGVSRQ